MDDKADSVLEALLLAGSQPVKGKKQDSPGKRRTGTEQEQGALLPAFIKGAADKKTHGEAQAVCHGIVQCLAQRFVRCRSQLIHVKDPGHVKGAVGDRMEELTGQNHRGRFGDVQESPHRMAATANDTASTRLKENRANNRGELIMTTTSAADARAQHMPMKLPPWPSWAR
jgi:hypothetical protein